MSLAKYAVNSHNSQGRIHSESSPKDRNEFQRDRDRIIHSAAFRRLEYKTQVFINNQGDLYRTRLTHSIEVGQIARSIARNLGLNEDLTEAISLAHDLGHTPFGHAGQKALNKCMSGFGGFEHNLHSLKIVDQLEEHYASFRGLNLCFETREGILKHCSIENAKKLGAVGSRFINNQQPTLEAQLVDISDSIAYNNHDIDDGLRSGLLNIDVLRQHELFEEQYFFIKKSYPNTHSRILIHETVRRMIHVQVTDLIENSKLNLSMIDNISDVRNSAHCLIVFSDKMHQSHKDLKRILRENFYQHPEIQKMTDKAQIMIADLFNYFLENIDEIPKMNHPDIEPPIAKEQICSNYIAGMTDRFAEKTWRIISGK